MTWFVIGRYVLEDEDNYEEIFEKTDSLQYAKDLGRDYAPWMGDDWDIILRHRSQLRGTECDYHEKTR